MSRLSQVISVEKTIKSKVHSGITKLHRISQKEELFFGFNRKYTPIDDEGLTYPDENKKVEFYAYNIIEVFSEGMSELIDATATKDWGNCSAYADVIVDGVVIIPQAPTPFLLFLEKQLLDIKTFVEKLPTLTTVEDWETDINTNLFKTKSVKTYKTKREQKPVVLYEATPQHPAQVQLIPEDVVVGSWDVIKHSSALPEPKKFEFLKKIEKLSSAVKYAREEANSVIVEDKNVGKEIFSYLFNC